MNVCAETGVRRSNGTFKPKDEFAAGDKMYTRGRRRCAKKNARVRVSIDADDDVIGRKRANDAGGYLVGARIPKSTETGSHTIIVRTSGYRYEAQIEVAPRDDARGAGFNAAGGPMLAAWAALAGAIAAVFFGTRRRRRPVAAPATPHTIVPTIDTSSFVPFRSATRTTGTKRASTKPRRPSKPKTKRQKPSSPGARKTTAAKQKPAPEQATKRRASAKRKPRGTATTKRNEATASRRPTRNAKPTGRKRGAGGPKG